MRDAHKVGGYILPPSEAEMHEWAKHARAQRRARKLAEKRLVRS